MEKLKLQDAGQEFVAFCRVSGIRAFGFAEASRSAVEKYFWLAMIIGCLGLTFYDVTNNFSEYLRYPTAVKATIQSNQSLNFTGPMFCLEFFTKHMNFGTLNLSEPMDVYSLLSNQSDLFYLLQTVADEYRNSPKAEINGTTDAVISLLTAALINIVRSQHHINSSIIDYNYTWGLMERYKDEYKIYLNSMNSESLATVGYFLSEKNISPSSLIPIIGEILCWKVRFQVEFYRYYDSATERITTCSKDMVSWLGTVPFQPSRFSLLCLRLNEADFDFDTSDDSTNIVFYHPGLYRKNVTREVTYFYLAFTDGPVIFPRSQNLFYYETDSHIDVNIHLHGVLNNINSPYRPCGTESGDTCRFRCRIDYIREKCRCSPVSAVSPLLYNLTECGLYKDGQKLLEIIGREQVYIPSFNNCAEIRDRQYPNTNCNAKCSKLCVNILKTFQVTPKESHFKGDLKFTRMKIYAENFDYPFMQEFYLLGLRELVSMLGGTLSFYLGANFIIVLHAFIYWIPLSCRNKTR